MTPISIIILAGGCGKRMNSDIPKQFLPLCGVPVLVHTVRRFMEALPTADIIVVVTPNQLFPWSKISREYSLPSHEVCTGGDTRFMSVNNALKTITHSGIILVHDGVRPLVSKELIQRVVETAIESGTAVPVTEPVDSFRVVKPDGSSTVVDRTSLRAVQTPQAFGAETLRAAYGSPYSSLFTDDASVVESHGTPITLCTGERSNIKITTPIDIIIAQAFIELDR